METREHHPGDRSVLGAVENENILKETDTMSDAEKPVEYMTREHCDELHKERDKMEEERQKRYTTIIQQSLDERLALWNKARAIEVKVETETKTLETKIDDYKKTINGKFDTIIWWLVRGLWAGLGSMAFIVVGLIGVIYSNHVSREDLNEKIRLSYEARAGHQAISQANHVDLDEVLMKLEKLEKEVRKK
jgi:hypothetical protein